MRGLPRAAGTHDNTIGGFRCEKLRRDVVGTPKSKSAWRKRHQNMTQAEALVHISLGVQREVSDGEPILWRGYKFQSHVIYLSSVIISHVILPIMRATKLSPSAAEDAAFSTRQSGTCVTFSPVSISIDG